MTAVQQPYHDALQDAGPFLCVPLPKHWLTQPALERGVAHTGLCRGVLNGTFAQQGRQCCLTFIILVAAGHDNQPRWTTVSLSVRNYTSPWAAPASPDAAGASLGVPRHAKQGDAGVPAGSALHGDQPGLFQRGEGAPLGGP